MKQPLLALRDVALSIGARRLLRSLSLDVERGQFWAVLGPNGSGKTTLLATLAGLTRPSAGEITLLGRALQAWKPADAAGVRGFLPQHAESLYGVSALQGALLGRHPHQGRRMWEDDEDLQIAWRALDEVGLAELASRDVASLSGGERQRVAIASLLAQDPLLWLLDEPLSHLDLHQEHAVMRLLRERIAQGGERAVVASLHDLSLAARFATHALVFTGGGECVTGHATDVLDEETLSRAFGHRVRRLTDGELVALVPG